MVKSATIYDVASGAGVSITTVSRYLNNPQQVAEKTRKRIQIAMRELEFVPKAEAVARARTQTRRIAVLTPFLTAQSFVQRIDAIHRVLLPKGYEMITYTVDSQDQLDAYLSVLPVNNRIDAMIVLALPISEEAATVFDANSIPLVGVEVGSSSISSVEIDNIRGGKLAASYLVGRGYRQMGFFGESGEPVYSMHATQERLQGFSQKLSELGFPIDEDHICFHEYGIQPTVDAALELLSRPFRPDAVFCSSDYQAICVQKAARMLDIRVPQQLGILGFDDTYTADFMELSTIRQSLERSGEIAAGLVIDKLEESQTQRKRLLLDLTIVERKTT
jgi:LacI family transcriptional regulator